MVSCPCGGGVAPEDQGFKGINKDRKCTDLLCLLIFSVFCLAGVGIGIVGITNGQPESLVYGKDDNGNICGSTNGGAEKKKLCDKDTCYFADGAQVDGKWAHTTEKGKDVDISIDYLKGVLVSDQEKPPKYVIYPRLVEDLFDASQQVPPVTPLAVEFFGICIDECPTTAGWTCSPYGKGVLADTLKMDTFPASLSTTDCPKCEAELDDCQNNGIVNPTAPISMHKYKSEKCSKLLKSCFYSSLKHTDTMFRCFPMYSQNVSYACDDDNDGLPDAAFLGLDGKPMNGLWQTEEFSDDQITLCGTLIKKSLSQQSASPNIVYQQIASAVAILGRMIADLRASLMTIAICGIAISIVCGFLWLLMLRYCARVFVWLTIVLVVVMELLLCVFFYVQAGMINVTPASTAPAPGTTSGDVMPTELESAGETNVEMFKWAAIGMTILLVVQLMGIIAAIKKINVAAEIISEASKAVASMKSLMIFPIVPVFMITGIFLWFVYIAVCLYSVGEISGDSLVEVANTKNSSEAGSNGGVYGGVNMTASASFKEADWGKYLMLLHVFIALWGNAFVQGFMTMTIAGAVSNWYFTVPEEGSGEKVQDTKFPVPRACCRTVRYHLGSVAFGAGIIAAVQLARAIMTYIDHQTKTLQDKNILIKVLMKVVHCILWCFEKCIKFLTKNAYIFIAIKGSSFCWAAKDVFYCLKENMGQMAVVQGVAGYLMLIGKVVIVACSTVVCYILVSMNEDLSSPIMPVVVTALLAFFIASVFLDVYGIAIDTILISFCIDKKNNDGSEKKKYFMSNKMRLLSGVPGDENSCYSRADDGADDGDVKPFDSGATGGDEDGDDDAPKKSQVTPATSSKKEHFDTEMI